MRREDAVNLWRLRLRTGSGMVRQKVHSIGDKWLLGKREVLRRCQERKSVLGSSTSTVQVNILSRPAS